MSILAVAGLLTLANVVAFFAAEDIAHRRARATATKENPHARP